MNNGQWWMVDEWRVMEENGSWGDTNLLLLDTPPSAVPCPNPSLDT